MIRMAVVFLPKTHNPSLIITKTLENFQVRDILKNICPVLLATINIIKNKESEKLSEPTRSLRRHDL